MALTPPFLVRRFGPADEAAVLELARSLDKWFDPEGLRRIARDLRTHTGFVAVQDARIVGFLLWSPIDPEVADLAWMGIAESRQRQGVGTALLAVAIHDLRSAGFRVLEVSTAADNVDYEPYDRTRLFYRARGFADFRVDPGYWGSGDDRYDRLVLRRDLSFRSNHTYRDER